MTDETYIGPRTCRDLPTQQAVYPTYDMYRIINDWLDHLGVLGFDTEHLTRGHVGDLNATIYRAMRDAQPHPVDWYSSRGPIVQHVTINGYGGPLLTEEGHAPS